MPEQHLIIFPGEVEAVNLVISMAEAYGYGNLIGHLKRAWALRLMKSTPGLTYNQALLATEVTPYPENWSIENLKAQSERLKNGEE